MSRMPRRGGRKFHRRTQNPVRHAIDSINRALTTACEDVLVFQKDFLVAVISRRRAVAAVSLALGAPLFATPLASAGGFRRIVRIGVVNPLESAPGQACRAFVEAAATMPELDGIMQMELHANGELGGEIEMVKACAAGALDLVFAASNVVAVLVPELGLLDAPFLFRDAPHAHAVLDGSIGQEYIDLLQGKGLNVLAWGENGTRHVTANKPIRMLADLRGLRIRVPQSEMMVEGFRALGAAPETLPFPQLFEALRTGRFEAQENPVATIAAAHLERVQSCLSLTGHAYSAAFFLASPDLLDDLNPAQRAALLDCARLGARASRIAASRGEREGVEQLRASGMAVVADVDRTLLAAAAAPALEAAAQHLGADRVVRIRAVQT